MSHYLFIQSRDPFEANGFAADLDLAAELAGRGDDVTVFLVQNGVLPTRSRARTDAFDAARSKGVSFLADEFSLRERGIATDDLKDGIEATPLDVVVDRLAAGHKTIWL